MARCKWCKKKGWLLAVDSNGLCRACQPIVIPVIESRARVVVESGKLVQSSKNVATRLSRIRVALDHLEGLLPYEQRKIPTLSERPSALVSEFKRIRSQIISEYAQEQVYAARRKAEDASTATGKLGGYAKAIESLDKIMDELDDVSPIESVIVGLRFERDKLRFQQFEQKAEAALMKGNKKAALGAYVDAYMALKSDTTPDDQQRPMLDRVSQKIEELGGLVP